MSRVQNPSSDWCVASASSSQETAILTISMHEIVKRTGCQMKSPFITMAFMCLPAIPDIKLTDRHLMDTKTMSVIY